MINKIKDLKLISIIGAVVLTALLFSKPFELGKYFFYTPRLGEFFGLVVRFADLVLFGGSLIVCASNLYKNFYPNSSKCLMIIGLGILSLIILWFWGINSFNWQSLPTFFLREIIVTAILTKIVIDLIYLRLTLNQVVRYIPLLPFLLLDHLVLSNSVATLIFWILYLILDESKFIEFKTKFTNSQFGIKTLWCLILFTNLSIAIFQILFGHSLGLFWFGESKLQIGQEGVATQQIFGQLFLRGYGLMAHPNITAFLGFFLLVTNDLIPITEKKFWKHAITALCVVLILFTFSRMGLLAAILYFAIKFLKLPKSSFSTNTMRSSALALGLVFTMLTVSLIFFSSTNPSKVESDSYRQKQDSYWVSLVQMQPVKLLTGIGPGQYSTYLQKSNLTIFNWENEPTYNSILLLIIEIGILPLLIITITLKSIGLVGKVDKN
ncbi:MAG: hypothetical protein OHK0017_08880 [Patescibacteria group bacterium]